MKNRIIEFLTLNGWEEVERSDEFISFGKINYLAFDVSDESVVVIGEDGDIAEFPVSQIGLYALLGFMMQCHVLDMNYLWPETKKKPKMTTAEIEKAYDEHTKTKYMLKGKLIIE